MARANLQVKFFNDFTGGLNNKSSRQTLMANETPDCQDVLFNARGGFVSRRGYRTSSTQATMNGGYIGGQFSAGSEVLWGINNAGALWTWTGSSFTVQTTASPAQSTRTVVGAVWDNRLYFANWLTAGGVQLMRYWDGTAFTSLGNTVNNTYTAPVGGNAPAARHIASHSGHMFWADTVESTIRYRSRVRWSHPLQPGDFAAADYFDIEPDDETNQITALVPFKEMLLVFKRRGVYAIYGYDRSSFTVERLSTQAGVSCPQAVSTNAGVAYWWSVDGNVYAFNGRGISPIGDRVIGVLNEGSGVAVDSLTNRVAWMENQLWVSLLKNDGSRVCFVYDPAVGQAGAWTRFSFAPTSMFWWRSATSIQQIQFTLASVGGLFDMGNVAQAVDDKLGVNTTIDAYYRMAWFSASDAGLTKSWKRPHITVACGDTSTLIVEVFHDFAESTVSKTLTLPITLVAGDMVWGTSLWGTGIWASSDPGYEFARVPSLGRSHSVQLKLRMSDHTTKWWVDSITIPFVSKTYR